MVRARVRIKVSSIKYGKSGNSQKEEGVGAAIGDAGLGVAAVPRPVAIMRRIVGPSSWISTGFLTCISVLQDQRMAWRASGKVGGE